MDVRTSTRDELKRPMMMSNEQIGPMQMAMMLKLSDRLLSHSPTNRGGVNVYILPIKKRIKWVKKRIRWA